MFDNLLKKLTERTNPPSAFNPSQLDDPIALITEWMPVNKSGSNYQTHKLIEINQWQQEFKATPTAKLFYYSLFFIGLGITIGFPAYRLVTAVFFSDTDTSLNWLNTMVAVINISFPVLVGLILTAMGTWMLYFGKTPIVFDKQQGLFWKGRKKPESGYDCRNGEQCTELKAIHALQLISKYCQGDESSYYSYELNLVLKNGRRINVVDHGDKNKLREDTAILATFLGKPVWDAL